MAKVEGITHSGICALDLPDSSELELIGSEGAISVSDPSGDRWGSSIQTSLLQSTGLRGPQRRATTALPRFYTGPCCGTSHRRKAARDQSRGRGACR